MSIKTMTPRKQKILREAMAIFLQESAQQKLALSPAAMPILREAWELVREERDPPLEFRPEEKRSPLILPPSHRRDMRLM